MITANPAIAVAWISIWRKRSSRPSPRRPRIVSLRPPNSSKAPNPVMIAREPSPLRGVSAINSATNHFDLATLIEHLFHGGLEESSERERERQRGRVAVLLDRVDRLPRHA